MMGLIVFVTNLIKKIQYGLIFQEYFVTLANKISTYYILIRYNRTLQP